MSDPTPLELLERDSDAFLSKALAGAREAPAWPARRQDAVFQAMKARGVRRRHRVQLIGVAMAAAVLTLGIKGALDLVDAPRPELARSMAAAGPALALAHIAPSDGPRWDLIELAEIGLIEVSGWGSVDRVDLPGERQLRVRPGTLRAHILPQDPNRPVVVVTPHLRIVVLGTRFDVAIEEGATTVHLLEGRVRVESPSSFVVLEAGSSIRSDDPKLLPAPGDARPASTPLPALKTRPTLPARPPPLARPRGAIAQCSEEAALDARIGCYAQLAERDGLVAESALYTLGSLARDGEGRPDKALEHWRRYRERFPDGTFAPEVSLGIVETLLAQGRLDEALAEATRFERQFSSDPRAGEVTLARVELLCSTQEGADQGRALLRRLEQSAEPRLRQAAATAGRRCRELPPTGDPALADPGWSPRVVPSD